MKIPYMLLISKIPLFIAIALLSTLFIYIFISKVQKKKIVAYKYILLVAFICYLIMLYEVLIGISGGLKFNEIRHQPNIIPIISLLEIYDMGIRNMLKQVILNIVIMIPFGFLLPCIFNFFQSNWKTVGVIMAISLLIEILQYFIGRSADIDDFIMNTIGAQVGYLLFLFLNKIKNLYIED
ncbi:VanZ family protein [Candidatus Galacturonibacter soehngenii]|uniref:VanZ family protein n=2 Tax=Candidatus Galacturonatibacter soehngenii TaxID=2307010 RepID=A0A7V7QM91_9FIRM|nr:VanZ family protein [Candidatus Galacturonibacter soehngenii]